MARASNSTSIQIDWSQLIFRGGAGALPANMTQTDKKTHQDAREEVCRTWASIFDACRLFDAGDADKACIALADVKVGLAARLGQTPAYTGEPEDTMRSVLQGLGSTKGPPRIKAASGGAAASHEFLDRRVRLLTGFVDELDNKVQTNKQTLHVLRLLVILELVKTGDAISSRFWNIFLALVVLVSPLTFRARQDLDKMSLFSILKAAHLYGKRGHWHLKSELHLWKSCIVKSQTWDDKWSAQDWDAMLRQILHSLEFEDFCVMAHPQLPGRRVLAIYTTSSPPPGSSTAERVDAEPSSDGAHSSDSEEQRPTRPRTGASGNKAPRKRKTRAKPCRQNADAEEFAPGSTVHNQDSEWTSRPRRSIRAAAATQSCTVIWSRVFREQLAPRRLHTTSVPSPAAPAYKTGRVRGVDVAYLSDAPPATLSRFSGDLTSLPTCLVRREVSSFPLDPSTLWRNVVFAGAAGTDGTFEESILDAFSATDTLHFQACDRKTCMMRTSVQNLTSSSISGFSAIQEGLTHLPGGLHSCTRDLFDPVSMCDASDFLPESCQRPVSTSDVSYAMVFGQGGLRGDMVPAPGFALLVEVQVGTVICSLTGASLLPRDEPLRPSDYDVPFFQELIANIQRVQSGAADPMTRQLVQLQAGDIMFILPGQVHAFLALSPSVLCATHVLVPAAMQRSVYSFLARDRLHPIATMSLDEDFVIWACRLTLRVLFPILEAMDREQYAAVNNLGEIASVIPVVFQLADFFGSPPRLPNLHGGIFLPVRGAVITFMTWWRATYRPIALDQAGDDVSSLGLRTLFVGPEEWIRDLATTCDQVFPSCHALEFIQDDMAGFIQIEEHETFVDPPDENAVTPPAEDDLQAP